jgi:D-galactonate transporter
METRVDRETRIIGRITAKLIPFLILLYVVAYVDRSTLGFAKLQMNADAGLSDSAYGLGAGLFFIGYFLFEVPSNVLLVRFGARRWFARILVTWGAVTVAMALIHSPTSFYVLRFLLGAAEAGFYPGVVFFLGQWFPMRHRARIFGLFMLAQPFALIVTGPLAGGLLGMEGAAGLHGWQWLFILSGLPAIVLAWPTLRLLPDSPRDARWLHAEDRVWLDGELERERRETRPERHPNPLLALKDTRVLLLALYFLPYPLAIYGLSAWLPTIIKAFGGVSNLETGLLSAIPYLFAVAGLLIVPRHSDRTGERFGHIAAAAALGAAGLVVSASAHSHVVQLGALCFTAFGLYAAQPIFWTLPGRFLTGPMAAAGIAVINSLGNLGGYIGPFGIGLIKERTGNLADGLYFLALGVFLFAVLLTLVVKAALQRGGAPAVRPAA